MPLLKVRSLSAEGSPVRRPVLSVSVLLLVVSYIKDLSTLKSKGITGLMKPNGSVFFMIVTANAYPSQGLISDALTTNV